MTFKRDDLFAKQAFGKGTCIWRTKFAGIPVAAMAVCEDGVVRTIRLRQKGSDFCGFAGRTTFPNKLTLTGVVHMDVDAETLPVECYKSGGQQIPRKSTYLKFTADMKG